MQYIAGKFYKKNDVVLKNGMYYVASVATNKDPESSRDWQQKAGFSQPINTAPVIIKEHVKGEKGDKGDKGDRGEKGIKGDQGERGEKGAKGDKGDKGDKGNDGKDGKDGIDGVALNGKDGKDGRDGKDGKDGKDGFNLYYKWEGTKLGIRREDEPDFQYVDLKGSAAAAQSVIGAGGRTRFKDIVEWFNPADISADYANKKISITASGGISDGDKGDITVSASGATWVIDNDAVTYAKLQNVSDTDKLLGRASSGSGDVEEITCTAAGRAILDDIDASAQRATLSAQKTITSGTSAPSGGADGDIYLQYV